MSGTDNCVDGAADFLSLSLSPLPRQAVGEVQCSAATAGTVPAGEARRGGREGAHG